MELVRKFTFPVVLSFVLLSTVSCTLLEKIFVHERGPQGIQEFKKLPRMDIDQDAIFRRAIEDLKDNIPKYTGFFFLDLIFEVVKTVFVFIASLLVPAPDSSTGVSHEAEMELN